MSRSTERAAERVPDEGPDGDRAGPLLPQDPDVEGHPVVARVRRLAAEVLAPSAADVDTSAVPRSHLEALAAAVFGISAPAAAAGPTRRPRSHAACTSCSRRRPLDLVRAGAAPPAVRMPRRRPAARAARRSRRRPGVAGSRFPPASPARPRARGDPRRRRLAVRRHGAPVHGVGTGRRRPRRRPHRRRTTSCRPWRGAEGPHRQAGPLLRTAACPAPHVRLCCRRRPSGRLSALEPRRRRRPGTRSDRRRPCGVRAGRLRLRLLAEQGGDGASPPQSRPRRSGGPSWTPSEPGPTPGRRGAGRRRRAARAARPCAAPGRRRGHALVTAGAGGSDRGGRPAQRKAREALLPARPGPDGRRAGRPPWRPSRGSGTRERRRVGSGAVAAQPPGEAERPSWASSSRGPGRGAARGSGGRSRRGPGRRRRRRAVGRGAEASSTGACRSGAPKKQAARPE